MLIPLPCPRGAISGESGWTGRTGVPDAHVTGEHLALPGYYGALPTLEMFSYDSMPERSKAVNAVMENFFGILKSELLCLQKFNSLEHFVQKLVEYLDYYNSHR